MILIAAVELSGAVSGERQQILATVIVGVCAFARTVLKIVQMWKGGA